MCVCMYVCMYVCFYGLMDVYTCRKLIMIYFVLFGFEFQVEGTIMERDILKGMKVNQ